MSTADLLALSAASWGVVMALAPLLQIKRMMKYRSSTEISLGYFSVLLLGFGLWIAYGISIRNYALIVPNAVAATTGLTTIAIALRYRHPPAAAARERSVGEP